MTHTFPGKATQPCRATRDKTGELWHSELLGEEVVVEEKTDEKDHNSEMTKAKTKKSLKNSFNT